MTGSQLRRIRKQAGQTQVSAAAKLGVSQTYMSLLEKGERRVTLGLSKRAARAFGSDPVTIPFETELWKTNPTVDERLDEELAALGYPGYSHLKKGRKRNPAEVLIGALSAHDLDVRSVEALPWLVFRYFNIDWKALIFAAKIKDIQNRLGFVVNVARRLSELAGDKKKAAILLEKEEELSGSRLLKEETLCRDSMTNVEKRWLRDNRPPEAEFWRLLTDMSPKYLDHVH